MRPRLQFVGNARAFPALARGAHTGFLVGALLLGAVAARAQNPPPLTVGQVEGNDVSVEGGAAARNGTPTVAPRIYVSNGSTVTVHSGRARMTLFAGGKLEICGPAKFTVLLSGDSVTLALNFGRVRVQLPAQTSLRVFSPTIIATPIEISGGARDVTVGLNLDDSLCVLASSGALQLEHQFTGEKLIVPQRGEFFLNGGRLVPVAGRPGSCQCFAEERRTVPPPAAPPPEYAVATPLPTSPQPSSVASSQPSPPSAEPIAEPSVEFSIPAHANETHPVAPPARGAHATAPHASVPIYTVSLPALTFSASSPNPPPDPTPDMFLLIREARVLPEWEFTGRVEVPGFIGAMQHALGEKSAANEPVHTHKKKKGGFWAALKHFFGGRGEE
jgi:hypothetical protein